MFVYSFIFIGHMVEKSSPQRKSTSGFIVKISEFIVSIISVSSCFHLFRVCMLYVHTFGFALFNEPTRNSSRMPRFGPSYLDLENGNLIICQLVLTAMHNVVTIFNFKRIEIFSHRLPFQNSFSTQKE